MDAVIEKRKERERERETDINLVPNQLTKPVAPTASTKPNAASTPTPQVTARGTYAGSYSARYKMSMFVSPLSTSAFASSMSKQETTPYLGFIVVMIIVLVFSFFF